MAGQARLFQLNSTLRGACCLLNISSTTLLKNLFWVYLATMCAQSILILLEMKRVTG